MSVEKFPTAPVSERRFLSEVLQMVDQQAEAVVDRPMTAFSYGRFYPSYKIFLELQKKSECAQENTHKSLLIGALTLDTVKEYEQTVKRVHPLAQTFVTDVEGVTTVQRGEFAYGSGLELPYASNSLDSVHTNILLHQLYGSDNRHPNKRASLFAEMLRVLKPRGYLIMVESKFDKVYKNGNIFSAGELLKEEIQKAGFCDVRAIPALELQSRRHVYGLPFLPDSALLSARRGLDYKALAFNGVKPMV